MTAGTVIPAEAKRRAGISLKEIPDKRCALSGMTSMYGFQ
jgi:hypothetical protein